MSAALTRAVHGRAVAGVCAGLARHLGVSVTWTRVGVVLLSFVGGAGLLFYAWLWIFLPSEQEGVVESPTRVRGAARPQAPHRPDPGRPALWNGWQVIIGVVVLAMAVVLGMQAAGVPVSWGIVGPAGVVLLGVAVAWLQIDVLRGGTARSRTGSVLQLVLGLLLVLGGVVALASGFVGAEELWLGLFVAVAVIVGLLLVAAPWVLKAWRDHLAERTALAAQTERAEIAAHLHDSVLQTLALIQKNAEDPTRVARYARAQERELRQYLYQDPTRPTGTLGDRLEELAETLEQHHGQPIEVIAVGEAQGPWLDSLVQAAQEAMLNGVRHAGPVRVYAEAGPDAAEVFVRDRGTGFDLGSVPADRLGVRESIIGRMRRSGGSATLDSTPEGTEVHLRQPRPADERIQGPAATDHQTLGQDRTP